MKYGENVAKETDIAMKKDLVFLHEKGFRHFETNKMLLTKYKNVDTVLAILKEQPAQMAPVDPM